MSTITYTDPVRVTAYMCDTVPPAPRFATGYGRTLPTRYRLRYRLRNGSERLLRVYVMNYGNSGSAYVRVDGEEKFLDTDTEYALNDGHIPDHMRAELSTVFCFSCGNPCYPDGAGTGYAIVDGDRKYCYPCTDRRERLLMSRRNTVHGYISTDGHEFTTWSGGLLARITRHTEGGTTFGGNPFHYWSGTDETGRQWWGKNSGPGMAITMRASKSSRV